MKDHNNRPQWDAVFMALSFVISQRSLDTHTKHGCFIVDHDKSILSAGYNGPLKGSIDCNVPLTRPEKYSWFEHSERNAIYNSARHGIKIDDSTFYITGRPCTDCLRAMVQSGAKRIICGPINSACISQGDLETQNNMLIGQNVIVEEYNETDFIEVLIQTLKYIQDKTGIDVKSKLNEEFK